MAAPPLPPLARPRLPRLPPPLRRARLFGEESGPICFHSESLKIPFRRNERRKARVPRPARWVPARARRRAGGGRRPSSPPRAPGPTGPGSRAAARSPHLHEARTRGPSAKAQLNAGGGRRPKLAFPRPSGARSGRGRTKGAGRGERRVCRGIDLQMRLCQRVKAGRTPDPAPAPPAGPRPLAAQARAGTGGLALARPVQEVGLGALEPLPGRVP